MNIKKISVVFLAILMSLVLMPTVVNAANPSNVEFTATINTPVIEYNETEDQEVTIVIAVKEGTIEIDGIGGKVLNYKAFNTSVSNDELGFSSGDYNYKKGNFGWSYDFEEGDTYAVVDTIMEITYVIPAGTAVGEYELGIQKLELTYDGGFEVLVENVTVSATLTIKEPCCSNTNPHSINLPYEQDFTNGENHFYTWTASKDGTVTFTSTANVDGDYSALNIIVYTGNGSDRMPNGAFTFDMDVNAGDVLKINAYTIGSDGTWTAKFTEACDHTNTELIPNDDGTTHNECCADCGTTLEQDIDCSGTDDGDCTTAVTCECDRVITAAKEHSFNTKNSGKQATPANCINAARNYVQCDNCNIVSDTVIVSVGEKNSSAHYQNGTVGYYKNNGDGTHSFICGPCGQVVDGKTGAHDKDGTVRHPGNCQQPTIIDCSVCKSDITYSTVPDVHAAGSYVGYRNNNNGTHTAYHPCCNVPVETVPHDYTTGTSEHTCVCGEVEKFELSVWVYHTTPDGYVYANPIVVKVPFGANVADYIPENGEVEYGGEGQYIQITVTPVGGTLYENSAVFNGIRTITGWIVGMPHETGTSFNSAMTMPAGELTISQTNSATGWNFARDPEGKLIGTSYVKDDEFLKGWQEINDSWYYFDTTTYFRAEGLTEVPYNTELGHAANSEDLTYADFPYADTAWYVFGTDGKLDRRTYILNDDDTMRYVEDGLIAWHPGFKTVDNTLYYFVGDADKGNKAAQGQIYVTRINGTEGYESGDIVEFVDGQVKETLNGIVDIEGVLYYYENGKLMAGAGLVKIGKDIYYVRSSGEVAIGEYYITKTNNMEGFTTGMKLIFDENGKMEAIKNGIIDGVYYVDNHVQYGAGLVKIGEDIYYVRSSGEVATGAYYITNTNDMEGFYAGMKLFFGEDGKMEAIKNGIIDGVCYSDNHIKYGAGLIEIDGDIYYVRSNGEVAIGTYYITNVNDMEGFVVGQKCYFDNEGKLIVSEN